MTSFTTLEAKTYTFTNTRLLKVSKNNTAYSAGYKISTFDLPVQCALIWTTKLLLQQFPLTH
jgi:hypothetical protein